MNYRAIALVPPLIEAFVKTDDDAVSQRLIKTMGELGPIAKDAIPVLEEEYVYELVEKSSVRGSIEDAIKKIDDAYWKKLWERLRTDEEAIQAIHQRRQARRTAKE